MHIHGQIPDIGGTNFYGVSSGERAEATRRAAEVRKRLRKAAAQGVETGSSPEESMLIGRWLDARHGRVLSGDEERFAESGRDADLG